MSFDKFINSSKPSLENFNKLTSFHLKAVLYLYKDCKNLDDCRKQVLERPQDVDTICLSEDLIRIKYSHLENIDTQTQSIPNTEEVLFANYGVIAKTLKEIEDFSEEERSLNETLQDLVNEIISMERKVYYLRDVVE